MRKIAALAGAAALGLSAQAYGYGVTAEVTIDIGGNGGQAGDPGINPSTIQSPLSDIAWTSNGTNTISSVANGTYFSNLTGYNSRSYYNPDFATAAQCSTIVSGLGGTLTATRKYGCRYNSYSGTPSFVSVPVADIGPTNARASGTITVTDTTLTGTLTIQSTTDEPTGATTAPLSPTGARLSNSQGNGFEGYNYRSADGSPFGNYWQGITLAGTYVLNLTGSFTDTAWDITGGTAYFTDPGFACQQGGLGSTSDAQAGTLCTQGTAAGSQQYNGAHLSWGWDIDGSGPNTAITEIDVRDAGGASTLSTLSGVLASISIDGAGNITTNSGEFRRALGSASGGCSDHIRFDGTKIACGTLTTGRIVMTGTVVPLPAAAWLMVPAVLAAGRFARRRKAA